MKKKEKKEKRPVAHKRAIQLLRGEPHMHLYTVSKIYSERGAVVPAKDIPELIEALQQAGREMELSLSISVKSAVQDLQEQQAEAKKEQREKEKGEET